MMAVGIDDFEAFAIEAKNAIGFDRPLAFGLGIATIDSDGNFTDTFFQNPRYDSDLGIGAVFARVIGHKSGTNSYKLAPTLLNELIRLLKPFETDHAVGLALKELEAAEKIIRLNPSRKVAVISFIAPPDKDEGAKETPDAYLRLHLLSHRLVKPNGIKLNEIFKTLPNVAWTSLGAVSLKDLNELRIQETLKGNHLTVYSVDKFPKMVDYAIPGGTRIADASRVRLGAYLGEGTTVMHEGFVNFNAGCEGPNMIEGRVSAGVFIKKGTDLGGGCSTMGTLSGGGETVISIGENCLIGANAGVGISLGNGCVVEAGLYVTAGAKALYDGKIVKARDLSGADNLLFRRNSLTGGIEVLNKTNKVTLNEALHANAPKA